jgi:hypothetical protein
MPFFREDHISFGAVEVSWSPPSGAICCKRVLAALISRFYDYRYVFFSYFFPPDFPLSLFFGCYFDFTVV